MGPARQNHLIAGTLRAQIDLIPKGNFIILCFEPKRFRTVLPPFEGSRKTGIGVEALLGAPEFQFEGKESPGTGALGRGFPFLG
jgi:hypothetical protein